MSSDRPLTEQLWAASDDEDGWPLHGPRSIHAHLTRPIVQQLVKAKAHSVLDLGCGNGWFSGALDRCGFEVTGVDHSAAGLHEARQLYPTVRFQHMDATQPPDATMTLGFDAVVAIDLIDHVAQPRRLIETAIATLKPGGLLLMASPFHGYAKNLALALTDRFDLRWDALLDHGRVKFFSRATLVSLVSEFDLRELHFETVGRIPMFARSMLVAALTPS